MKNVITLVAGLSLALAGGLSPEYGPTDWNAIGSTSQGFVVFDNISIGGEPAVGGVDDGSSTGTCDTGDCDIVALMYGANCVGWSYSTVSNGQVTIAINFNDFVTPGVEDYPMAGGSVSVNVYDASAGLILYSVTSAQVFPLSQSQQGDLDAVGAAGGDCNYVGADNFDQFGSGGGPENCSISACCDGGAVNSDPYAGVGSCSDDGSCLYAGCQDAAASNYYDDGYDCAGGTDGDQSCCTYLPSWGGVSSSQVATDEGYATSSVQLSWSTPQGGTIGDGWSFDMPDGGEACEDRAMTVDNAYPWLDKARFELDEKYRKWALDIMREEGNRDCGAGETELTLTMNDAYGDGWNGSNFCINDTDCATLDGVNDDGSSGTATFCVDLSVTNNWSCGGGSWTSEVSWTLTGDGVELAGGAPESGTVGGSGPEPCADNEISLSVGGGSWCSEVGWSIDGTENSGSCGDFDLCLADGDYNFSMTDSYGDGWNGNMAVLTDSDGNVIGSGGLDSGADGAFGFTVGGAPPVAGCTNPDAPNYDATATIDDGSCEDGCYNIADWDNCGYYISIGYDCGTVMSYGYDCSAAESCGADCPAPDPCAEAGGIPTWLGDGYCDGQNNNEACGYDSGDCCPGDCVSAAYDCGSYGGDCTTCIDPGSGDVADGGACDNAYCYTYDLGWGGTLDYTVTVYGGAVDADGNPAGVSSSGSITASDRPIPPDPANASISDSGEGYITVSWDASYEADGYTVSVGGADYAADGTSLTISPLAAGAEHCASVTADNSSGSSGSSDAGCATLPALSLGDGDLSYDDGGSSIGPFNALLAWSGGPAYGDLAASEYTYTLNGTGALAGSYDAGAGQTYALFDLEAATIYSFTVTATSQYGSITGGEFAIETLPPGNIPAWGFDVQITFAALGQELVTDTYNRFGFSDEASDGFDPDWDYPEPDIAQPNNNVHFYFENDFSLETEWGDQWTHDVRKLQDDLYAHNNTTTFEGRLVASVAGRAILHTVPITAGSPLPASDDIPVYVEVNGNSYLIASGGMADEDDIPIDLEENVPTAIRFVVGNLLPEAADNMGVADQGLDNQSHHVDTPTMRVTWDEDSSCDNISEESLAWDGGAFQPATYDNIVCNSHEQRYPSNAYQLDSHHSNDAGDATSWNYDAGNDGSHSQDEEGLEYGTEYGYTVRAFNNAGEGGSTSGSDVSVANQGNTASASNTDGTDAIEAECTGDHCGTQLDDTSGDNVYTPAHDGDENSAPVEVTINGSATDPEDYALDLAWGCVSGCEGVSPSPGSASDQGGGSEDDVASITSTFTVDNPYGNGPKTMTFELTATDDDWPTNGGTGSHSASDQVTIHVNAEQNQRPTANIAMSGDNDDCDDSDCGDGLGYWQVPHDGSSGGTSTMTLSSAGSSDPDAADTRTFVWTESDPGTSFNDLNGNGILDAWEGNSDDNTFDPNGFNPIQEEGELHTSDELSRELYPGGYAFGVTTTDNYGDSHSTAVALYVHNESNDAALASAHNNSVSGFMDNAGVHYLPPGASSTQVQIWGGSVSDAEGDAMNAATSVNGADYSSQSDFDADGSVNGVVDDFGVGTHTVTICVQDSYGGYQYQELFNADGSPQIDDINDCASYSFEVRAEPEPVGAAGLSATGGLYHVTLTWDASVQGGEFSEYGENATSYSVERSSGDPTDDSSYEAIGTVSRDFTHNSCDRKDIEYGTYTLECDEPGFGADDIDGELNYMGRGSQLAELVPDVSNIGGSGTLHFLDNWLDASTTYYYRVTPSNSHGDAGGQSETVTVTTLDQPGVELTSPSAAQIWESGADIPAAWSYTGGGGALVGAVGLTYTGGEHSSDHCTEDASDASTGSDASGNSSSDCAIGGTSDQTDHGQEVSISIEDIGDYYGNNRGSYGSSSGSFTTSETELTHGYFYQGWHVFGSPLDAASENPMSVAELLETGMPGSSFGADYVYFDQDGNFGLDIFYEFGTAYFLGLQSDLVSLEVSGNLLTSDGEIEASGDHSLAKGWNLVAPKLVRSVDTGSLTVNDGNQDFSWGDAQNYGLVSGQVIGTDADGNYESGSFAPWSGYWIHTSRALDLIVRPHSYDAGRDQKADDTFAWDMQLRANPVDGKGTGDIVKVGMHENAVDGFRYGEDSYDIPLGMDESYVNLYMHRNWAGKEDVNGIVSESNAYYSDSREVISPDQAHVFDIQSTVTNITSDIRLSWNMDELDEAYKVTLLINGDAIDMRAETEIVVEADALHNMTVLIGDDPFAMAHIPTAFGLGEAYPNPFNPMTSMQLSLSDDGYTSIKVYNLMGQIIDVIQEGMMQAGYHNVVWDAAIIPSGVYLVKVEQGDNIATQKVMLMK